MSRDQVFLVILLIFILSVCIWTDLHAQSPPAYWFSLTNGDTVCRAYNVSTSPLKFSYYCGNPRGATAGSYTAATANTALDVVEIGLAGPPGGNTCLFAVNATATAATLGSFGPNPVPSGTISWQCSSNGQAAGNSGSTALKGKK